MLLTSARFIACSGKLASSPGSALRSGSSAINCPTLVLVLTFALTLVLPCEMAVKLLLCVLFQPLSAGAFTRSSATSVSPASSAISLAGETSTTMVADQPEPVNKSKTSGPLPVLVTRTG